MKHSYECRKYEFDDLQYSNMTILTAILGEIWVDCKMVRLNTTDYNLRSGRSGSTALSNSGIIYSIEITLDT